jgi:Domain of unknown function (DUF6398)
MLLSQQDAELFFKLHRSLLFFVNQRLRVVPDQPATSEEFGALAAEVAVKVRDAFVKRTDLIELFVAENPAHLSDEELLIVRSWQYLVHGRFYIFRELSKYTVFLSTGEPPVAYGVMALSQPFEELVGPELPVLVETVLLPFNDSIVYDGLLRSSRIFFGPGIRRSLNESYKDAKAREGIVTSLPMAEHPLPVKTPKRRPAPRRPAREETAELLKVVLGRIDQFCQERLNGEYAMLCRKLAEKLARKRPSPLLRGSPDAWASGIVRAIGWVNFLGDKSQTPHMRLIDIDAYFGISESTGAARLAAIRKLLKLVPLDPNWTLPSRLEDNPLVWMLSVNGFLMDIRLAPREAQEAAYQKGLIPYIPADRQGDRKFESNAR